MADPLTIPVRALPGVPAQREAALGRLGIETVFDLLHHLPRRHEDRRAFKPIAELEEGETAIVHGVIERIQRRRIRSRRSLVEARVRDDSGSLKVTWWNQPWREHNLPAGTEVVLYGKIKQGALNGPEAEVLREDNALDEELPAELGGPLSVGRLVPIYPLTKGMTVVGLRRLVAVALARHGEAVPDPMPEEIRRRLELPDLPVALRGVHFPGDHTELDRAMHRLRFDECFYFELAVGLLRARARRQEGIAQKWSREVDRRILARLPFELTAAQSRAAAEVLADLREPVPMNRLLQGDVGSGKTAVALYAALVAVANRTQVAFLAPTEVLARQHFVTLERWLKGADLRVELFVGSSNAAERRRVLQGLAAGRVHILVGTHAILEPAVEFQNLALVVVDEQHKFGVAQRAKLIRKGVRPDVLVMTATPIPRTLAMTAFGDLDVSVIDELPPGRTPPETRVLRGRDRERAYRAVRRAAEAGARSFVIYPLVSASEDVDAEAAEEGFRDLGTGLLRGLRLGLITGRTPAEERIRTMQAFRRGDLDVLVGTTVLEVGVDVPDAQVMVVESAERFGLSTLHQLRGRIGRGGGPSFCFLVAGRLTAEAEERLRWMEQTHDGFEIAEQDLKMRGPGEFFGTRQHGLPEFVLTNPLLDLPLLKAARQEAFALLERDPRLQEDADLRREFVRRFRGRMELYEIG